jgi:hypothetical protein
LRFRFVQIWQKNRTEPDFKTLGRDHSFLEGMNALFAVATHYQRLLDGVSSESDSCIVLDSESHTIITLGGTLIRYGAPEPWKAKAAAIGRTKPTRAPKPADKQRKKNDGRPPDTVKELLGKRPKNPPPKVRPAEEIKFGPASYQWHANSCWLDASLQILYTAITPKFDEFTQVFESLKPGSALNAFYQTIKERSELDPEEDKVTVVLGLQRDQLRIFLHEKQIIDDLDQPESAVVR